MKSASQTVAVIITAGFICAAIVLQLNVNGMVAQYDSAAETVQSAVPQETDDTAELDLNQEDFSSTDTRHVNYRTIAGRSLNVSVVSSEDGSTIFMYTSIYDNDSDRATVKLAADGSYEITESTFDDKDVKNILRLLA